MNITHSELVRALAKPGDVIQREITASDCHLMHMAIGICGESGEMMDAIKKQVIYRKHLDRANVIEELGDLEFYMEGLRQELGITREQTLEANIEKLSGRYKALQYTDKAAQARSDKLIVHHLLAGVAPCGIKGVPKDWPENHKWSVLWNDVTCPDCLAFRPKEDTSFPVKKVERAPSRRLVVSGQSNPDAENE